MSSYHSATPIEAFLCFILITGLFVWSIVMDLERDSLQKEFKYVMPEEIYSVRIDDDGEFHVQTDKGLYSDNKSFRMQYTDIETPTLKRIYFRYPDSRFKSQRKWKPYHGGQPTLLVPRDFNVEYFND
jgi:hypothetical protein